MAEVGNKTVLSDLVQSKNLINEDYSDVHFDSLDERSVDVALLYKGSIFKVEHSETFSVYLQSDSGEQDYTRDILLVHGMLKKATTIIKEKKPNAKIIVMGDFNDYPNDASITLMEKKTCFTIHLKPFGLVIKEV